VTRPGRSSPTPAASSPTSRRQILKDLGISSIRLLTSAEHRYVGLAGFGIEIAASEPIG
jgi:GTP cyclohydrolase II